jgi:hypothetical protein
VKFMEGFVGEIYGRFRFCWCLSQLLPVQAVETLVAAEI